MVRLPLHRPTRVILALGAVAGSLGVPSARGVTDELVRAVPEEALVAYFMDGPSADTAQTPSSLELATLLVDKAREFGLLNQLDEKSRGWLDTLTTLSTIQEHAHVMMLIDVKAKPVGEESHRLAELQAALVLRTQGKNAGIERRIQQLLNECTNTTDSKLSTRQVKDATMFVLEDSRFPSWMEVSWGAVGECYVVAAGKGAMEAVVESLAGARRSLAADAWFRPSWEDLRGAEASFAVHIRFDALRKGTDRVFIDKVERAMRSIGAEGVERGLWTVGRRDRAVVAGGIVRRGGKDEIRRLASASSYPDFVAAVVPPEATWYAALDVEPVELIRAVADTYLAARSPGKREEIEEFWDTLQTQAGVSIETDLLRPLRTPWLVHSHPLHALQLPLAWTRVVRIEGAAAGYRQKLDQLMEAAQKLLAARGGPQLRHDADGLWCLQIGLDGPSIAVVDAYLVIGFAPDAVHKNAAFLRANAGR